MSNQFCTLLVSFVQMHRYVTKNVTGAILMFDFVCSIISRLKDYSCRCPTSAKCILTYILLCRSKEHAHWYNWTKTVVFDIWLMVWNWFGLRWNRNTGPYIVYYMLCTKFSYFDFMLQCVRHNQIKNSSVKTSQNISIWYLIHSPRSPAIRSKDFIAKK